MAEYDEPSDGRFRFSLRTLLGVTAAVAVAIALTRLNIAEYNLTRGLPDERERGLHVLQRFISVWFVVALFSFATVLLPRNVLAKGVILILAFGALLAVAVNCWYLLNNLDASP